MRSLNESQIWVDQSLIAKPHIFKREVTTIALEVLSFEQVAKIISSPPSNAFSNLF